MYRYSKRADYLTQKHPELRKGNTMYRYRQARRVRAASLLEMQREYNRGLSDLENGYAVMMKLADTYAAESQYVNHQALDTLREVLADLHDLVNVNLRTIQTQLWEDAN